jgi:hypothetical protein
MSIHAWKRRISSTFRMFIGRERGGDSARPFT